jgi:pimeloyl-ACP methyl ester carboxylesterase
LDNPPQSSSPYHAVRDRLHVARLRTVFIAADPRLTAKSTAGILDSLDLSAGVVVGDREGARLAWQLAATCQDRFTGLVAVDCGHPRAADAIGAVQDPDCPLVDVDTTVLVGAERTNAAVRASMKYVRGEFRLVDLAGWRGSQHFVAQLTAEIVLRSYAR